MSDKHDHKEHAHGHEHKDEKEHQEHDHDHAGHDHSKEKHGDHAGHDHAHSEHKERPVGTKPAEQGGIACQLDLELVLPEEKDEAGIFEKLKQILEARTGISNVHLRSDAGRAEVCVHYNPRQTSLSQVLALVRGTGVEVSDRYKRKTWMVRGMDCGDCEKVIDHALHRLPGVLYASVAYASERLVVEYDRKETSPSKIEARIKALGYQLEEPESGHACSSHGHGGGLSPKLELPLSITSGVLMGAGLLIERMSLPPTLAAVCFAVSMASGGYFAALEAIQSLKQRRFDIESLMVLAAIGAAALGAWFEGSFLLFLFSLGHAFEHRAMERARNAIEALGKLRPEVARVKRGAEVVEVPINDVEVGTRVVVRPGDRVPLDGVIRDGKSAIDQAAITGESVPVAKGPGDEVFSGSINTESALEIEVTKKATESVLAKVVNMVAEAEAQKSPTQRFTKELERKFVPLVLLLVIALPFILLALGTPLKEGLLRAISLLVAASPCALAISTPAAVLSAVARAARGGVLMKGGAHLESLGKVKAIAFDKTGTLTEGKPRMVGIAVEPGVTEELLLATSAGVEALSAHPLAKAVVDGAKERGITPLTANGADAVHGKGIRSTVEGETVTIGNLALFEGQSIPDSIKTAAEVFETGGKTTMIVKRGERFLGVLAVADTLRPEAKAALAELKALGIERTVMLSGDNLRVARAIAKEVGIDDAKAPLMPDGKVKELKELSRSGGVAMVGDGVNDAPALAAASVGISMGGAGSDVAMETADVVLMGDNLQRLPFAVGLSRSATTAIRQNLIISLGVSAVLMVATIFGWAQISDAVIFHEGSTIIVVLNGLRLLRY